MSRLRCIFVAIASVLGITSQILAEEPAKAVTLKSEHFAVVLEFGPCPQIGLLQAATLDSQRQQVLIWGGVVPPDTFSDKLASFDLSTRKLTEMVVEGRAPDGVAVPAMAMDAKRQTAYVFGGWAQGAKGPSNGLSRVGLQGNARKWERIQPGKSWPSGRNGACLVSDPEGDCLLLIAGDGGPGDQGFTPLGDLWRYDLGTGQWQSVKATGTSPPARWHAMATVDPKGRKLYVIGGAGLGDNVFDRRLYELDLKTAVWRTVKAKEEVPPSLQGATLTFDSQNGILVLLGGLRHERPGPATSSEIWIFDIGRAAWEHVDGGNPAQRRDHTAVYDAKTGYHYMLGGHVSKTIANFYEKGVPATSYVVVKVSPRQ